MNSKQTLSDTDHHTTGDNSARAAEVLTGLFLRHRVLPSVECANRARAAVVSLPSDWDFGAAASAPVVDLNHVPLNCHSPRHARGPSATHSCLTWLRWQLYGDPRARREEPRQKTAAYQSVRGSECIQFTTFLPGWERLQSWTPYGKWSVLYCIPESQKSSFSMKKHGDVLCKSAWNGNRCDLALLRRAGSCNPKLPVTIS